MRITSLFFCFIAFILSGVSQVGPDVIEISGIINAPSVANGVYKRSTTIINTCSCYDRVGGGLGMIYSSVFGWESNSDRNCSTYDGFGNFQSLKLTATCDIIGGTFFNSVNLAAATLTDLSSVPVPTPDQVDVTGYVGYDGRYTKSSNNPPLSLGCNCYENTSNNTKLFTGLRTGGGALSWIFGDGLCNVNVTSLTSLLWSSCDPTELTGVSAVAQPIPTISQWGLIILSISLSILGVSAIRKRVIQLG